MSARLRFAAFVAIAFFASAIAVCALAQESDAAPSVEATSATDADEEAERRISEIFAEIETLQNVNVEVRAGVASLTGRTVTAAAADRAKALAAGVPGVVAVENQIERDVSVPARVAPAIGEVRGLAREAVRLAPVIMLALLVFAIVVILGGFVARWTSVWRLYAPNPFLLDLTRATIRVAFFVLALIAALSLLDATPLLGAVFGAAGVVGLAVGFGLRDIAENFIASVLLSVRQPFRPLDHVSIDGREGRVARVTPRATILVTLDGNQLRLPNAAVFKAVILNFTVNPERRFDFELTITPDKDAFVAIKAGRKALSSLPFVLKKPSPAAVVTKIDANTVLSFSAWIDQRKADFAKSRSIALATTKNVLEAAFAAGPERSTAETRAPEPQLDTSPELEVEHMVREERRQSTTQDLLGDAARPE